MPKPSKAFSEAIERELSGTAPAPDPVSAAFRDPETRKLHLLVTLAMDAPPTGAPLLPPGEALPLLP